jgi:hypothetical protein
MVNSRIPSKTAANPVAVRQLEQLLREEVAVCEQYLAIISKEQLAVTKLDSLAVSECSNQREQCLSVLNGLKDRRVETLRMLSDSKKISTTEVVTRVCQGKERQRILALVDKLRDVLTRVESTSRECNQVVDFSLGLVNGSLSILWSATQDVTKGYTPYGTITEGTTRQPRRRGALLGEA